MAVQNVINMTKEIAEGGGNRLSSDLPTITAEINAYKRIAGEAIFEIGRRLKHVKENDLAHGEFGKWLESVEIDKYEASRYIKVFDELYDDKLGTYTNIGLKSLYLIATMPEEARSQEHTLKSGTTKKPEEMTVKELREVKRQLKAEKAERERLERELDEVEPEVRYETRTEYVEVKDEEAEQRDLAHGEFGKWLESIEIDRTLATRLMKVASEFDPKYATLHNLGLNVLYEIATMPETERLERELDEVEPEVRLN